MNPRWSGLGAAGALALTIGASQAADLAIYPAAQCAAFFLGRQDFANRSALLDPDPDAAAIAAAYRAVALRLAPDRQAEIDAYIAKQRPQMETLFEAFISYGDRQSADMQERLTLICGAFAAKQPELDGLR